MNIDLTNIINVRREGVNKFVADLRMKDGSTVPVAFSRVPHYWTVSLMVTVNGRAFHEYDGEFANELVYAKQLWVNLDVKASEQEAADEKAREAQRGAVFVALGGAR